MRIARILLCLCCTASAAEEQWTVSAGGMDVPFKAWHADGARAGMGLLVLVPGYNGDGGEMLDQRWKAFAEKNGLLLLAPTFKAEGHENNEGRGYYYPKQGRWRRRLPRPGMTTEGQDIGRKSPRNRVSTWMSFSG